MADLLTRPLMRRETQGPPRAPWLAGVVAGAWGLLAGLALVAAPVLLDWAARGAQETMSSGLRTAGRAWLLAQGVPLTIGEARVSLVPWGVTLVLVLLLHRAGRWAAHTSGLVDLRGGLQAAGAASAVLGTGAGVVAALTATGAARAAPSTALAAGALVGLVAVGAGVGHQAGLLGPLAGRLPPSARRVLRAAAVAAGAMVALGSVLLVISLAVHLGRVRTLYEVLDPGLSGGLVVTLLGAALLPNAAVWGAAVALGPGFAVGADGGVAAGGAELGAVPALPVLGALPDTVPLAVGGTALLLPLLAGGLAAVRLRRDRAEPGDRGPVRDVLEALLAGAAAGVTLGLLALAASGAAGPGRLASMGPDPWSVTLAGSLQLGAATGATAAALSWWSGRRPSPTGPSPTDPGATDPGATGLTPTKD